MEGDEPLAASSALSPSTTSSQDADARLVALLKQPQVSDDTLLDATHDVALAQYADMLLQQQDQRCAAHTARLRADGWFDPPSSQQPQPSISPVDAVPNTPTPSFSTVVPKELEVITSITGRPFTLDASVFPTGIISPIAKEGCSQDQPFLTKDLTGHHSWVCVPPSDLPDYIDHYLAQKQKDPQSTSACFVVPSNLSKSSSTRLTRSVCPSVCGWKAVLGNCWIPKPWHIFVKSET